MSSSHLLPTSQISTVVGGSSLAQTNLFVLAVTGGGVGAVGGAVVGGAVVGGAVVGGVVASQASSSPIIFDSV